MSTHCIVSIDKNTMMGIYKNLDGYPTATIPSIIAYINLYGYDSFVDEYKRIEKSGGCETFYYVDKINGDYGYKWDNMIRNKQLAYDIFISHKQYVTSYQFGFLVLENEIRIYKDSLEYYSIKYKKNHIENINFIIGVFEDDYLDDLIINKYKVHN